MKSIFTIICLFLSLNVFAVENCKIEQAKDAVNKMCDAIKSKGKDALKDVAKYRFCGANYVWIQDKDVKMVFHPIKPRLNGKDLKGYEDEKKKKIFVEFDKVARGNAKDGGYVSYVWAKPGAEKATPKKSFVKVCEGGLDWIAGSGVWE